MIPNKGCSDADQVPTVEFELFRGVWPDIENTNEKIGATLLYDDAYN